MAKLSHTIYVSVPPACRVCAKARNGHGHCQTGITVDNHVVVDSKIPLTKIPLTCPSGIVTER